MLTFILLLKRQPFMPLCLQSPGTRSFQLEKRKKILEGEKSETKKGLAETNI
jgi:hypothetical protein